MVGQGRSGEAVAPEGLALTDPLAGTIERVHSQADLNANGQRGGTTRTISEVLRYLQLCRTLLRLLTGDPSAATKREHDGGGQSSRSGAQARSVGRDAGSNGRVGPAVSEVSETRFG